MAARLAGESARASASGSLSGSISGVANDVAISKRGRFGRRSRLCKAREFRRVFAEPFRSSDAALTVLARANDTDSARLGLAIARKHVKRAVHRNRIKRIIRESFRSHQRELSGLDVVVLARGGLADLRAGDLTVRLARHWGQVSARFRSTRDK